MLKTLIKTIAVQNCNFPEKNAVLASPRQRRTKVPHRPRTTKARKANQGRPTKARTPHQPGMTTAKTACQRRTTKAGRQEEEEEEEEGKDQKGGEGQETQGAQLDLMSLRRQRQTTRRPTRKRRKRSTTRQSQRTRRPTRKERKRSTTTRPRKTRRRNESSPAPRTPRRQSQTKRRRKRSTKTTRKTRSSACTAVEDKLKIGQKNAQEVRGKEALQAAYTAWNDSDLALFLSDIVEHAGKMAGRDGAQFELAKVHELLQPYLGVEIPVFRESGWLDAVEAKALLLKMQKLAEKTEELLMNSSMCRRLKKGWPTQRKAMRKRGPPWNDAWKCWKAWLALRLQIKLTCIFIRRIFLWWLFFQLRLRLTSPAHSKRSGGISWKQFPDSDRVASPWCLQNKFKYRFVWLVPPGLSTSIEVRKTSLWVRFSALRTLPWKIWERRPDARSTLQPCTAPQAAKLSSKRHHHLRLCWPKASFRPWKNEFGIWTIIFWNCDGACACGREGAPCMQLQGCGRALAPKQLLISHFVCSGSFQFGAICEKPGKNIFHGRLLPAAPARVHHLFHTVPLRCPCFAQVILYSHR